MAYRIILLSVFSLILFFIPFSSLSQSGLDFSDGYLTPPESISNEILAPRHESVSLNDLSPSGDYFLNTIESGLPSLSAHAKPHYNIAGLQIDPRANRHRSFTTRKPTIGLELINSRDGKSRKIYTPAYATFSNTSWSPDGKRLAFFAHFDNATHIYVADVESGRSKRITEQPVLATLTTSFEWAGDGESIFTVLIPDNRGPEPSLAEVPAVLQVRVTSPGKNRLQTYQSLLKDSHDANRLKYHVTGQLANIDVNNFSTILIGEPAMIRDFNASPAGDFVIVQNTQNKFSFIVPASRFGWTEQLWDLNGNIMSELRISETRVGNSEDVLNDFGRRDIQWRPDGQGLSFLLKTESSTSDVDEDQKDVSNSSNKSKGKTEYQIIQWFPPFDEDSMNVIYTSDLPIHSVSYSNDADILFITERRRSNEHLYAVFTDEPDSTYSIYQYSRSKFYDDPGSLMKTTGSRGVSVVQLSSDNQYVFLNGTEYYQRYTEQAPRPFIDKVNIRDGNITRIFQSSISVFENIIAVLDNDMNHIILERESAFMHPDSWIYDTQVKKMERLTNNTDYNKAVTQTYRDRFRVKREDGFEFWMEVVMPPDWDGKPLPGLIWHYPQDYSNQRAYNRSHRRYNKNSYPKIDTRTADILVKEGYAVLKPDWPISGDSRIANDNFVESVVQNSTVVIDSAAARGYVDRNRMAIGGHSYGAFGASNAMIHTSFFKAGIAGAGNYNRTLTPMGFQRERSDLWRGADRYMQMSPILWADRLEGALLMYHGEDDQNVGTWPTNSQRMFHALNGLGKEAALYMYPHESHGPSSKETLLDLWTRWVNWLDYYLKDEEYPEPLISVNRSESDS